MRKGARISNFMVIQRLSNVLDEVMSIVIRKWKVGQR